MTELTRQHLRYDATTQKVQRKQTRAGLAIVALVIVAGAIIIVNTAQYAQMATIQHYKGTKCELLSSADNTHSWYECPTDVTTAYFE